MKCKSSVILLGVVIGLFSGLAIGADDFYVIPVRSGLSDCSDCDGYFVIEGEGNCITSDMITNGEVGSNDINSAQVQLRVSGSCSSGNSIRVIRQDGTVACEPDDVGLSSCSDCNGTFVNKGQPNSITSVMIMNGQVGSNDINSAQVQRRVSGKCSSGNSIRVINKNGTVTCEADTVGLTRCSDCDGYFASASHKHDTRYYTKAYVDALEARIAHLEDLLENVTRVGNDLTFSGVNVHIVNGTGTTDGAVNGLGNLIVGYNEPRGPGDNRTGSHNIVVGQEHNYSSYGGLIAGYQNTISGKYATVSGGEGNEASGYYSSVSGGRYNTASGDYATVSGGDMNEAGGYYSSVSGGYTRSVLGEHDWRAGLYFQEK